MLVDTGQGADRGHEPRRLRDGRRPEERDRAVAEDAPVGGPVGRVELAGLIPSSMISTSRERAVGRLAVPRPSRGRPEHRLGEPARERVLLARVVRADHRVAGDARRPRRARTAGRGRASSPVSAAIVRNADSQAIAPSATSTRDPLTGARAPGRDTAGSVPAPRASACSPAARSGRRRRCRRRGGRARHRRVGPVGWFASPTACIAAKRKSPDASPVKTRPGPVAAVGRRREADEEDPRVRVAEPGHRPTPVRLVAEAGDLLARDLLAPRDEPRAAPARDDLGGQRREAPPAGSPRPEPYLSRSLSSRRATTTSPPIPMTAR